MSSPKDYRPKMDKPADEEIASQSDTGEETLFEDSPEQLEEVFVYAKDFRHMDGVKDFRPRGEVEDDGPDPKASSAQEPANSSKSSTKKAPASKPVKAPPVPVAKVNTPPKV